MNYNFESDKNQNQQGIGDSLAETQANNNYPQGNVTTMMRDRFELLSAYLDGEVTATERRQVEEWLTNDPTTKRLYSRLLMMQQSFQAMPVPAAEQSAQELATKVLQRVETQAETNLDFGWRCDRSFVDCGGVWCRWWPPIVCSRVCSIARSC